MALFHCVINCILVLIVSNIVFASLIPHCPPQTSCVPLQDCPPEKHARSLVVHPKAPEGHFICELKPINGKGSRGICCHHESPNHLASDGDGSHSHSTSPIQHHEPLGEDFVRPERQATYYNKETESGEDNEYDSPSYDDAVTQVYEPEPDNPQLLATFRAYADDDDDDDEDDEDDAYTYDKYGNKKSGYKTSGYKKSDYKKSDYKKSDYKKSGYKKMDHKKSYHKKTDYDYEKSDYKKMDTDYDKSDYKTMDYEKSDYKKSGYKKTETKADYKDHPYHQQRHHYKKDKYYSSESSTAEMEEDPWTPFVLGCVTECVYRKNAQLYYRNAYQNQNNNYNNYNANNRVY